MFTRPTRSISSQLLVLAVLLAVATAIVTAGAAMASSGDPSLLRAHVIGELSGPLAESLDRRIESVALPTMKTADSPIDISAPFVVAGPSVASLGERSKIALRKGFAEGWPIALIDASVDDINRLHGVLSNGQNYELASGAAAPEAFAMIQHVDGAYAQLSSEAAGSQSFAVGMRAERAASLVGWLRQARRSSSSTSQTKVASSKTASKTASSETASPKNESSGAAELDDLVSAWTDTRMIHFSNTASSSQSTFQCVQQVWQAYQVSTARDFYYMSQVCNFSPSNTYLVRGKELERPNAFSNEDWDEVNWSNTSDYCVPNDDAGDDWTACDYLDYATGYHINMQPYSPSGSSVIDESMITLVQENPKTTSENSSTTHGVNWSIGGQVVAGPTGASASVSAGVEVDNSTTTTIPAYTIQNQSLNGTQNAEWQYGMLPVAYIDDSCTDTMYAPQDIQTQTFETEQDLVWQVEPTYRSSADFDGYFKVQISFYAELYESTMYVDQKGSYGVTNLSDCNTFGCSCSIVAGSIKASLTPAIMSIPAPSTDYVAPTG